MKLFAIVISVALLALHQAAAAEESVLARVTVYWRSPGSGGRASWNGVRLRTGHCAVDPRRIPFGSKVVFPDLACLAVDSGPDVVNRKAARLCARTAAERNAIVIDRFFETKTAAITWARAHPHFMTLRILGAETKKRAKNAVHATGAFSAFAPAGTETAATTYSCHFGRSGKISSFFFGPISRSAGGGGRDASQPSPEAPAGRRLRST